MATASPPTTEGHATFTIPLSNKPVRTWYKIIGDISTSKQLPLLTLHGGPGAGHQYFSPLADLYEKYGIPIILYDQVGSGNNTHYREKMGDEEFWSVDLFVQEIDNLVDTLKLRERGFNILGQSWGGSLAGVYGATQPKGLEKLIIASGPASADLYAKSVQGLLARLPEIVRKALEKNDKESEEYKYAEAVWTKRHVCKLDPFPEDLEKSFANMQDDPTVYLTMQGDAEFEVRGSLRDWEGITNAHKITAETLLTHGITDEIQPIAIDPWYKEIPNVTWTVFENSTHLAHWEERDWYIEVVGDFLTGAGRET